MPILVNIALYQAGWFFCVLGAAYGYAVAGAVAALLLTAVHVILAVDRTAELKLILSTCGIGIVVDSAQQAVGVITFRTDPYWPLWLPLWIAVIWAQFATLFHYALAWLRGRYLLAGMLGLLGGPIAYGAGVSLGAAYFGPDRTMNLVILALVWALLMPALVYLAERLAPRKRPAAYRVFQESVREG